ncbi:MAG: UbiD family decarboxylase [Pirellulales bacterium]|nr:UbiD family decarboxylase [Pirellulales bacterium]
MSFPSLADFLEVLHQSGELAEIDGDVNPSFELSAITAEHARSGGAALLFRRVQGCAGAVVTNLLGSPRRIGLALGVDSLDVWTARIDEMLNNRSRAGILARLGVGAPAGGQTEPKQVRSGPAQQVVLLDRDVDLARLPVPLAWPEETHAAITAGLLASVDPSSGARWAGRCDADVLGANRLAVRLAPHEPASRLLEAYRRLREPMSVALVLGGDPAMLAAAMAPLPDSTDAWNVAGLLRGKAVELTPGRRVKIDVPADAEIVIEGSIDPDEPPAEVGPRATPMGWYAPAGLAPVVRVSAVTHRANPVLPAMIHGPTPNEWVALARAMLRVFLPCLRGTIPELVDVDLPASGGGRHVAFASVRATHAGQARRAAHALWGLPATTFVKWLVVVDDDVDVRDEGQVWAAVAAHAHPDRDVLLGQGPPDPWGAAREPGLLGEKLAIDATAKRFGPRPAARPAAMSEAVRQAVAARWSELFG